jgi:hypothetical protein
MHLFDRAAACPRLFAARVHRTIAASGGYHWLPKNARCGQLSANNARNRDLSSVAPAGGVLWQIQPLYSVMG